MGDHHFSPSQLTVKVGATVTSRMLGTQEHDVWSLCLPHHGDGMYGEIRVVL